MTSQVKSRGFTIVELLIVIVIIAILAAITIVAYNGITARANTASAQSAAENAIKKAEAFNADNLGGSGSYPAGPNSLTGSASTQTFYLSGVSFTPSQLSGSAAPSASSVLNYYTCSPTGIEVSYFNYSTKTWIPQYTGGASSTGSTCTYQANSVGAAF